MKTDQRRNKNLNSPTAIKTVIKNLPSTSTKGSVGSTGELQQIFSEEIMPILCKLFYKVELRGTFLNLFYQNWYQNQTKTLQVNCRLILFLMKLDAETLKKISANQIQQYVKR